MKPFRIIFVFSFIVAIFLISGFLLKSNIASKEVSEKELPETSSQKILNSPSEKDLIITEQQLNDSLPQETYKFLNEPKISIFPENIRLEGKINKFFGQKVLIKLVPKATDGKVAITVTEAKIGPINAPKSLVEKIISPLEKKMIENQKEVEIKSIKLDEKQMTINLKE